MKKVAECFEAVSVTRSAWSFAVMIVLVVSFVISCDACFAADTIKIGIIDAFTGASMTSARDMLDGFRLAVEEINTKGGTLGQRIHYLTRDDQSKPHRGLAAAKELILREKVDVLVGGSNSGTALALLALARTEKIPFFVTNTVSDKITAEQGHAYLFNMSATREMHGRAAATVLSKKPFVKYWIAGCDYMYGLHVAEAISNNAVWRNLKMLNPKVQKIGHTWWNRDEVDYLPAMAKILIAKPDFIIADTDTSGMADFQKAAKATDLNHRIPFYQQNAIEHDALLRQGQDGLEGVYGTSHYLFHFPQTSANKTFVTDYVKAYKRYPTAPALSGYLTAKFIAEAFRKVGVVDKDAFISAIEGMNLDSPVGVLTMRGCDHQLELPMYFGVTGKDPKYPFLISADIQIILPKECMPSCEEVLKKRRK